MGTTGTKGTKGAPGTPGVLDFSNVSQQAIPTPSKYDIIPIHGSDRNAFKSCRRRWAWSSPSRDNLVPRAAVHGVNKNLWFGTGIHHALERLYAPHLNEDPVVTFTTWYNLQWAGGLIASSELKEFADREPREVKDSNGEVYKVKGLVDLLPFPDEFEELGLLDLGQGMMKFYKEYAEANDSFNVISIEHDFSVPVLSPDGEPLYAEDHRQMPDDWYPDFNQGNEFGPLMRDGRGEDGLVVVMKQVHARGRMDMVAQDGETGQYFILDHKTTARTDDDYFRGLDLDEQVTTYATLSEIEAKMNGLEYTDVSYLVYQALLKGYPKPPTILSSGMPSLNRQTETTTAAMFEKCIEELGIRIVYDNDDKMQSYYNWLLEKGDERYIVRTPIRRNKHQKRNAMIRLYYEAQDMLNPELRLYPSPSRDYGCLNCAFRTPCIAREDGSDWKSMIEDGYVPNWDR